MLTLKTIQVQTIPVGQLQTNCYLVTAEDSLDCLIIDPGGDAAEIGEQILRQNLKPLAMVATHGHYDHILGAYELQLAFNLPLYVHRNDQFLVKELSKRAQYWMKREIVEQPPEISGFIGENEPLPKELERTEIDWQIINCPGHTPGGVSFLIPEDEVVFTGDTLFAHAVGRTDLSYSSATDLHGSVDRLRDEFKGFKGYPGHGNSFVI